MTECLKCGKKLLLLADYLMSNFPKMYEYWKKDFEKLKEKLKEKLFSRLKYLMETTSMYKGYTIHTAWKI